MKAVKNLKVFTAFSGYDSQCLALDRLARNYPQFSYELVGWSEIDKYAIQAHNVLYPQYADRNYGDISKIDWTQVPDFDLFTYSFPCGLKGTLVKTSDGYKDISEVKVGDEVLTYRNRYRKILKTMTRESPSYYRINAIGCKLNLTSEHPLWVLRNNEEQWVKVKDLQSTDKISYCIPQDISPVEYTKEFMWLLGRYAADGWINARQFNSVSFAIGHKKEEEFHNNIPSEYLDRFKIYQKTALEYRIADVQLNSVCHQFGVGARNKRIPDWLLSADKESVKAFLDGYFSGDGHKREHCGHEVQMFTTVSKELFLGIQMLVMKVYGKVCSLSIRHDKRRETFNDTYNGQFVKVHSAQQILLGDKIFVTIKKIEEVKESVRVYNMSVEEDESYTCDNVNTHNCTDISAAGEQQGLAKGSGTRSSLLWECERAIEIKKPKFLLMENVKALVTKKFIMYFNQWLQLLEGYGYTTFSKVLNATDFGVPQNRERVFAVSILNADWSYRFPTAFPLEKKLADVLEENVDEKYYLNDETVQRYLDKMAIDENADWLHSES